MYNLRSQRFSLNGGEGFDFQERWGYRISYSFDKNGEDWVEELILGERRDSKVVLSKPRPLGGFDIRILHGTDDEVLHEADKILLEMYKVRRRELRAQRALETAA